MVMNSLKVSWGICLRFDPKENVLWIFLYSVCFMRPLKMFFVSYTTDTQNIKEPWLNRVLLEYTEWEGNSISNYRDDSLLSCLSCACQFNSIPQSMKGWRTENTTAGPLENTKTKKEDNFYYNSNELWERINLFKKMLLLFKLSSVIRRTIKRL